MRVSFHGSISKGPTRQRQSRSEWARGRITQPQADKGWVEWDFWRSLRLQPLSARPLPSGMVMARSGAKRGRRFGLRASQPVKWTEPAREGTHAPHPLPWRPGMPWFDYSVDRRASATLVMSSCGHQRCDVLQTDRATAEWLPLADFQMAETSLKPCSPQRRFCLGGEFDALFS